MLRQYLGILALLVLLQSLMLVGYVMDHLGTFIRKPFSDSRAGKN